LGISQDGWLLVDQGAYLQSGTNEEKEVGQCSVGQSVSNVVVNPLSTVLLSTVLLPTMPTLTTALPTLLGLVLSFLVLAWLSRHVSLHIQTLAYYATRSINLATVMLFLLLLPGIILHEGAHWLTARLLGLKAGKFRVWPKPQGRQIRMGSVSVQRGNLWQDSLVGLAPLILGSILIAWIGQRVFFAYEISSAMLQGQWTQGFYAFRTALGEPDGILWAYLLFAIGNAMMPSASDREPLRPLSLYVVFAALIYVVIGLPLGPLALALDWLLPTVQDLTSAFVFTIILDGVILLILYLLTALIAPRTRPIQ
jgi:hypothetical protein